MDFASLVSGAGARPIRFGLLIPLLALCMGCEEPPVETPPAPAKLADGVTVDREARDRLGLRLERLAAATYTPATDGFASVLAADSLAELDAELKTAAAARALADAARARAEGLYAAPHAISLAEVENTRRDAAVAAAAVERLERHLALSWGTASPFRDAASRQAWLARLTAGEVVLARLELPLGSALPTTAKAFSLLPLAGERPFAVEKFWPAAADPSLPGPTWLALVSGASLPQPGERLRLRAQAGTPLRGFQIPDSALVLEDGAAWVYVAKAADHFERRPLALALAIPGGYFAADGFSAGEEVVVHGAGLLLALETGARNPDSGDEED